MSSGFPSPIPKTKPGPPKRVDRPRRKGELTAERILDAAESLFAERGYAGTTLRDVASAVELRIPSIYNHFPSKEALYSAVLERGIRPVLELLAEFIELDPEQRIAGQLVERVMALLARRPALPRLIQHETLSGGEHLTPMLRDWIRPIFARANQMIQLHPSAERWESEQHPLLVLALYHVVVGYFTLAPLYKELGGVDLVSQPALAAQTRFMTELIAALLPDTLPGTRQEPRREDPR